MIDDGQFDASRRDKAAQINTVVPNAARVADFLNGGRDSFEADRRAALSMLGAAPATAAIVPGVLAFHQRAVRFLALEAGIRQFIDVGTGLPGAATSRDLAQSVDPACRVVYVDNDPMVLSHVRAFSQSTSQGALVALDAKLTDPVALLDGAAETLDFGQPVALLLPSTLPFIRDTGRAAAIVSTLMAALSPGSQLAICHVASDLDPALAASADHWNRMSPLSITLRSRAEVAGLAAGLELVDPGLVPVDEWRPAPGEARPGRAAPVYAVVARKPALSARPVVRPRTAEALGKLGHGALPVSRDPVTAWRGRPRSRMYIHTRSDSMYS
jgi:S-adenosyl methyltransferase